MHRSRWATWIIGALVLSRVSSLLLRPLHHDEGVNAWFVDHIWDTGFYKYDPTNYHGPSLFYIGFFSRLIFGDSLWALRLVPVLASGFAIILLFSFRKYIGVKGVWASLALATSVGFFYYSRYFFHESLLILSLIIGNLGFMRAMSGDKKGWLYVWIGGLCAFATKETAAIHTIGILGGLGFILIKKEGRDWLKEQLGAFSWQKSYWPVVIGLGSFFILFSGFLYNIYGVFDLFKAFMPWLHTGVVGNGHEKAWYYWLELMKTYEWPFLVGFVGCFIAVIFSREMTVRFLCAQGLVVLLVYSMVPYKTPWCAPSVIWLAAIGFGYLIDQVALRSRALSAVLAIGLLSYSSYKLYNFNFVNYAKLDEPYVYVQSTREYGDIMDAFDRAALQNPRFKNELIESQLSSQWPLPWVWRQYTNIRWSVDSAKPQGKIIIVDEDKAANILQMLPAKYLWKKLMARGGVWNSYVLIEKSFATTYGLQDITQGWEEAGP